MKVAFNSHISPTFTILLTAWEYGSYGSLANVHFRRFVLALIVLNGITRLVEVSNHVCVTACNSSIPLEEIVNIFLKFAFISNIF